MYHYLSEISSRLRIVLAAIVLAVIGRDRFYLLSQGDGILAGICRTFSEHPYVIKQITGRMEINKDIDCSRQSAASLEIYRGDSLAGWADADRVGGDGHVELVRQMRCIVLGDVIAYLERAKSQKRVLEIGTGNGDVIAYLARLFPQHLFFGVDLSVKVALGLYADVPNLTLSEGYALDLLETHQIDGDMVFASSTFCVFPPKELFSYIRAIREAGYSEIVLVDPLTRRFSVNGAGGAFSKHMARGMWGHNYTGYFIDEGYRPKLRIEQYYCHSKRPKVTFQVACGTIT